MESLVSTLIILFLVVDIALLYTIAWRYTYHIYTTISYDQQRRFQRFLRLLIIAPVFILLAILILIIWAWKTTPYERLVHALLILSLWLPISLMIFETILTFRATHNLPIAPIAVLLLAGIPILGLTSINHFNTLFLNMSLGLPFFIDICSLGSFYFLIFALYKKLSRESELSRGSV